MQLVTGVTGTDANDPAEDLFVDATHGWELA